MRGYCAPVNMYVRWPRMIWVRVVQVLLPQAPDICRYFPGNTSRMSCVVNQLGKKADVMIFYLLSHMTADSTQYDQHACHTSLP